MIFFGHLNVVIKYFIVSCTLMVRFSEILIFDKKMLLIFDMKLSKRAVLW